MNEKLEALRLGSGYVGLIGIVVYFIFCFMETNSSLMIGSIIVSAIALIAFAIKLVLDIVSSKNYGINIFLILMCIFFILRTAEQLI